MKKFLLIGPYRFRSTDGVIIQGIRNILTSIYGDQTVFKSQILLDPNTMSYEDIMTDSDFDGIIVCGTPWLWDSFQKSYKYKNLQIVFSYHKRVPKIFMGIGSCLSLELLNKQHDILYRKEEVQGIRDLYGDTTVITRDKLAQHIIRNAGLKSYNLPCPAYFSYGLNPKQSTMEKNVLVWCDPEKTISSIDWQNKKENLDKFYEICLEYNKKYEPLVYCSEKEDIPTANKLGLKVNLVSDYIETLNIMKTANHVLSGRVHYGVPAFVQGCKVGIIPIDSRCLVLSDWKCPVIDNPAKIDNLSTCNLDIQKYYEEYLSIITNVIPL